MNNFPKTLLLPVIICMAGVPLSNGPDWNATDKLLATNADHIKLRTGLIGNSQRNDDAAFMAVLNGGFRQQDKVEAGNFQLSSVALIVTASPPNCANKHS
jgi:hypothetical protein